MFYKIKLQDHVRVPPNLFSLDIKEAIVKRLKNKYEGYISKDLGLVIDISKVEEIKDGVIIPGDGASYYDTEFEVLSFKPELQEILLGKIRDIADFGAFISLGPIDGMIHISQSMDDFVSFSKDKVLIGKESKRSLKVEDHCRARLIAISYKDLTNPKLGLTMRQPLLGRLDWIEEDLEKKKKGAKK